MKHVAGLEEAGAQLEEIFVVLENHFRDMCDIEFTIEQGKLWMLQTRVGKRTAAAALHIAIEMEKGGPHHQRGGRSVVSSPISSTNCFIPSSTKTRRLRRGCARPERLPGAAVGEAVFSAADAVAAAEAGT